MTEKKKGRKHHRVVDTQSNLVHGTVHDANHRKGGAMFFKRLCNTIRHSKAFALMPGIENPC
ncbi:hypothetical protein [Holospora curviuscula]|uniref:hypothetical protein n=1 Tax=Holospora curviuscula TaxID=1082868 RepID=UPI0013FE4926|nr:hypothetical protein [Holospora curviuscula]